MCSLNGHRGSRAASTAPREQHIAIHIQQYRRKPPQDTDINCMIWKGNRTILSRIALLVAGCLFYTVAPIAAASPSAASKGLETSLSDVQLAQHGRYGYHHRQQHYRRHHYRRRHNVYPPYYGGPAYVPPAYVVPYSGWGHHHGHH